MFNKNNLKFDSVAEAVKKVMDEDELDETGLRKAAYAAHKSGQKMFTFKGKTYPVRVQGEEVSYGKAMDEAFPVPGQTKPPQPNGGAGKKQGSRYGGSKQKDMAEEGDCVTEPQAKKIAKKEVKGHEKAMHKESGEFVAGGNFPKKPVHSTTGTTTKDKFAGLTNKKPTEGPISTRDKFAGLKKEDMSFVDRLLERTMTDAETKKKEKIVMSMKDKQDYFKKKYGKRWKEVMYATATKQAMKEETEELDEADVGQAVRKDSENTITTDMLQGRVVGGTDNEGHAGDSFRKFKVKLAGDGVRRPGTFDSNITQPNTANKGETKERQKITTNPGPVDIKLDDKLTGPTPYTHMKKEEVAGELKKLRGKSAEEANKEIEKFNKKVVQAKEETELDEKNESHTHAAHYENDKGEWTGMNLFVAKDDEDAIKQAHDKCKEGCRLSRVERHIPVKEEVELDEVAKMTDVVDRKQVVKDLIQKGKKTGPLHNVVPGFKAFIQGKKEPMESVEYEEEVLESKDPHMDAGVGSQPDFATEKTIAGTPGWEKQKKDVKDKSGAVHTPMSRAKDLAQTAMKKIKSEMLGKAPGNN